MKYAHITTFPDSHKAVLGLLTGAVFISFSGVWVKVAEVTPVVSAFYRVLFGGLILLIPTLYCDKIQSAALYHIPKALGCGFIFALNLCFYHISIIYVGPGLGTILSNFQVFILAALGILLFQEKIRLMFLVSIPMAFMGLFMIVGIDWAGQGRAYQLGLMYGFGAAACYAAFLLSMRKLQATRNEFSPFFVLMIVSLCTAAFIAMMILQSGQSFMIPNLKTWLSLLALGVFSQGVGWLLISNALPHLKASLAGFILLLQPALSFVWDVLIFQRPTTALNMLGVAIALGAIYLGTASRTDRIELKQKQIMAPEK